MTRTVARLALGLMLILVTAVAARADYVPETYSPELLAEVRASGEPYLLDFYAPWCSTCRAQERAAIKAIEANPALEAIRIIRVDWDTHRNSELATGLSVTNRSTLILFEGDTELGRLEWDAREFAIRDLLELGI